MVAEYPLDGGLEALGSEERGLPVGVLGGRAEGVPACLGGTLLQDGLLDVGLCYLEGAFKGIRLLGRCRGECRRDGGDDGELEREPSILAHSVVVLDVLDRTLLKIPAPPRTCSH